MACRKGASLLAKDVRAGVMDHSALVAESDTAVGSFISCAFLSRRGRIVGVAHAHGVHRTLGSRVAATVGQAIDKRGVCA